MSENKIISRISKNNLMWFILCLSAILIVICLGLLSRLYSLNTLEKEISAIKKQVDVQNSLMSISSSIEARNNKQHAISLIYPTRVSYERGRITMLPVIISDVAKSAGLQMMQVLPELNTMSPNADSLIVNLILRGDFVKYRDCLIGLGKLPFLERIEGFKIEQTQDGLECQIRVKLYIG